jgi:hypothetical protein
VLSIFHSLESQHLKKYVVSLRLGSIEGVVLNLKLEGLNIVMTAPWDSVIFAATDLIERQIDAMK